MRVISIDASDPLQALTVFVSEAGEQRCAHCGRLVPNTYEATQGHWCAERWQAAWAYRSGEADNS